MVAVTILEAGVPGAAGAANAVCTITIRGDSKGWSAVKRLEALHHEGQLTRGPGHMDLHVQADKAWPQGVASITSASIKCSGDVDLGVHPAVLRNATIEGVTPQPSCGPSPGAVQCLLTVCGSSRVDIVDSVITGVDLTPGADVVLCVQDQAHVVVHNSTIRNNNASAIIAGGGSQLALTSSQVVHNTALVMYDDDFEGITRHIYAAGVTASGSSRVLVQKHSRIDHNVAYGVRRKGGGSFTAVREALTELPVRSSLDVALDAVALGRFAGRFEGYKLRPLKRFYGGGGLQVRAQATMVVDGRSSVSDNIAVGGSCGGALVTGNGSLTITGGSVIARNEASVNGGGLCAEFMGNLTVQGSSRVMENICGVSGCGVWVFDAARAVIRDRVSISSNMPPGLGAYSIYSASVDAGSVVRRNSRNHVVAAAVYPQCDALCLSVRDTFEGVVGGVPRIEMHGGGGAAVRGFAFLHLEDVDVRGNGAFGTGGGVHAGDVARLVVRSANFSVSDVNNMDGRSVLPSDVAMVGSAYLQGFEGALTGVGGYLKPQPLTICSRSFYSGDKARSSHCCAAYSYQFGEVGRPRASNPSPVCLPCPANAECSQNTVRSVEGFWHSSAQSTQIHRCPMFTDACAGGRDCKDGYSGNLCGVCAPGWGMTAPFKCRQCWPRVSQFLVYVALFCASLAAITYTVHATWADNKLEDTAVRVTDLIKVLVQFLQYAVILGSVSTWPRVLRYWFVTASAVFGATELSLDCWVKQNLAFVKMPSAYTRQLIFYLTPLVMFALVILLTLLWHALGLARDAVARRGIGQQAGRRSSRSALQLTNRLWVAFLVVSFYAYPSVVKASLSYFACKEIDDAKVNLNVAPYPQFAVANSSAGYWALDANEACLTGMHGVWAYALGLLSVLALCAGVPMWIWWFMRRNVPSADRDFKERFGFIYRNYRPECCWWEAVRAVLTVLLTVVAVFPHNIGAYHALLLMVLFLLLSAVVQQWQKPYAEAMLHHMHMLATTCLILSAWLALNMPSLITPGLPRNEQAETAIGALMLLINGMFVVWCIWKIVQTAHATWKPMQVVTGWLPRVCCFACVDPRDPQRG